MGWKLLAATSAALFIISGLLYWFSTASVYAIYVAPGVDAFATSRDGDYFVVAHREEVKLYSSNGDLEWSRELAADVCAAAFSHDGDRLAVFAGDRLYFLSASDGSVIREVVITLSCSPSSNIFWAPGGDAVLVNARGRLAYVTMAGRGELTPYVGLTITRLKWLSGTEALAIDNYGATAYSISVAPLTVNTLAAYGREGSADFFNDGVFVIGAGGWAALIRPAGLAYNESLGDKIVDSSISGLGFAVVGDEVLAIDPSNGDIVWRASLGEPFSGTEVRACGEGVAVRVSRPADGPLVSNTYVFFDGEDILEKAGLPSNSSFLAWFGDCSAALVFDMTKLETYIVRVDGSAKALGGIYWPVSKIGNSLIVYEYRETPLSKASGAYLLRPDGSMEPLMMLSYSITYQINERTVLAVLTDGAKIVKLGEAPPQYSWAWMASALLGVATGAGAVWAWLRIRRPAST